MYLMFLRINDGARASIVCPIVFCINQHVELILLESSMLLTSIHVIENTKQSDFLHRYNKLFNKMRSIRNFNENILH